jgi:hypothetical protein
MHPSRYETYPKQIIIGYGEVLFEEDKQLFIDVTNKHRRNIEVLIYEGIARNILNSLNKMEFVRDRGKL